MNRDFAPILLASILAALPGAVSAASLESAKAVTLPAAWRSAAENPVPVPEVPAALPAEASPRPLPRQAAVYERGGFSWESDSQSALTRAESSLRSAGLAVLSAAVTRQSQGRSSHGFRIEYLQDPYASRRIETYRSQEFSWSTEAENQLSRTESSLRSAGYHVILGVVRRQEESPWNYHYEVDYVGPRGPSPGGELHVYTSGPYLSSLDAERHMRDMAQDLQAQGYQVHASIVYQDQRTRRHFFQIRYGRPWPARRPLGRIRVPSGP